MASGTGLLNQHTCEWDEELLEALGVSVESLPEIASPDQTFHRTHACLCCRAGRNSAKRVCFRQSATAPQTTSAPDVTRREKVALMIGTSGAMRVCFTGEPPERLPPELWCYRADRNRIVIGGALSDGGGLYQLDQRIAAARTKTSKRSKVNWSCSSPDAHGLTILPFWAGERSTGWNPDARGAILGLTFANASDRNSARRDGSDRLSLCPDCATRSNLLRPARR